MKPIKENISVPTANPDKIPIYHVFYLLKGDYRLSFEGFQVQGAPPSDLRF